jgi:hypothetical protein
MTRRISFISIVGAALVLAAPAFGSLEERSQAMNAQYGLGEHAQTVRPDAESFVRTTVSSSNSGQVEATGGREIEWPQVGIGLGIGILLGLGLWLALRYSRVRPLAH